MLTCAVRFKILSMEQFSLKMPILLEKRFSVRTSDGTLSVSFHSSLKSLLYVLISAFTFDCMFLFLGRVPFSDDGARRATNGRRERKRRNGSEDDQVCITKMLFKN